MPKFAPMVAVVAAVLSAHVDAAPEAKTEIIPLESLTIADADLLAGKLERGRKVTIAGELNLPLAADGRIPAVVLLHGSAGVFPYVTQWRDELAAAGIAAFVVDSFSARGIAGTIPDQDRLGRLNAIVDAYKALEVLRRHRDIDPGRVVLMGFSRGADSALYASLRRMHDLLAPGEGQFAAHVALYANCGTRYRRDTDVMPVPVRMFHGRADDYAPIALCEAYVERLKKAGADVTLTAYPGAHHVFMWAGLDKPVKLDTGQTTRACRLRERDDGVVVNEATNAPFTHKDPCVQLGPTVGYDADAAQDTRAAVLGLLKTLRPARAAK